MFEKEDFESVGQCALAIGGDLAGPDLRGYSLKRDVLIGTSQPA